ASAGIRLGMAFCSVKIIGYLNKVKPPYNISALNQEKALSILENKSLFDQNLNLILEEKEQLRVHLLTCEVVEKVYPSDANFYLVKLKTDAHRIYNQLIRNNVVVRNRSMLIENCIRVTVGTKEENELFINELKMCQNGE
ncbi:MAG: aminotransferase class I/II-fold pyridoxal phosphate-dependent enzyme, partial [Flavobacteriales bacterium]|nr:aminotransferase class I/II-fold pyridoxal phosphate-dependent enzyme [Flavobacteriales bacterium]